MAGKTDLRWSDEEWAALGVWAGKRGLSRGRAAKLIVLGRVWPGGPAAPEGRGSGGGDTEPGQSVRAKTVRGRPASSRPVGSAGSVGPEPPAGVAAPVDVPLPSAGAPDPVALEVAVARRLQARFGARTGLVVVARREIRAGKVLVDGRVCVDPLELVDPSALSG